MIHYATPYSLNKRLIDSYNDIFERVTDDEWACILDGDAMFTTNTFGHQIAKVVEEHGEEYKVLTCMTNRVANSQQVVKGIWGEDDMNLHRAQGDKLWDEYFTQVDDITHRALFSGVMILMQGKTWREIYDGLERTEWIMLGVDNEIHLQARDAGHKIGLMRGIYVMHYYRGGDKNDKGHLE